MNGIQKIHETHLLFDENISTISNISIKEMTNTMVINLRSGEIIYIRYNNYDEYSYTLIFSDEELDRFRFDNLDRKWIVKTKPHHFHPRQSEEAYNSPMVGIPNKDIPLLSKLIKNNTLNDPSFRF